LDSGPSRAHADLPDLYEATVVFYSDRGRKWKRKRHEMKYQLDFDDRKSALYAKVHGVHDVTKALMNITDEIRGWSEHGNAQGVSVFVRDGDRHDRRRRESWVEARAQHEELVRKVLPVDKNRSSRGDPPTKKE
jgi:hypothetical protein